MNASITKEEAQAWAARWRLVNAAILEEARSATVEQRMRDLESLFDFAHSIAGPKDDHDKEVTEVRRRWARLRESARAR